MSAAGRTDYIGGETWEFNIGAALIAQCYDRTQQSMHYRVLTGPRAGSEETVAIAVHLIRPGVFLVSWQEADGTTVVHLEDFDHNTFHSLATRPNGCFHRVLGSMRRLA
jgi:phenolic acid decarboxylase